MSRTGIMLCYPFEESRLQKWNNMFIIQPKLDGDRCRAIFDEFGNVTLLSSEANEINSVPHIKAELETLGYKNTEFDGELYRHGIDHQNIHGIVGRTVNIHNDHKEIEYHIFDIVNDKAQYDRSLELIDMIPDNMDYVKLVENSVGHTVDDVMSHLDKFKKQGYEGVILRHITSLYVRKRSIYVMKFKPRKSDYYMIVGYQEEISKDGIPKGTLGALILSSGDNDTFNVGSGSFLTAESRRTLWQEREKLVGQIAHIKYQHMTQRGVPRFPVLQDIVKV